MEIIYGNKENFDSLIKKEILVDFYADWCGPCKMLETELDAIKDSVQIVKVNVDENSELCKKYGIMSIPTLIYFNEGVEIKNVGFMNSEDILKWIGK